MNVSDFAVIIPARNAEKTLHECLAAVRSQLPRPKQIIVVNDDSRDGTAAIADFHGCELVHVSIRDGAMKPRLEGARHASAQVLVFIDADVVVPPGTFARILGQFSDDALAALTGRLSRVSRVGGFFSRFKNEYMHEIFGRRAGHADFLYGSIFAVRAEELIYFDPLTKPFTDVADSELGFLLTMRGRKIILDPDLQVEHLKRHGLTSILKNDFVIPFMFMRLLMTYRTAPARHRYRRFSHAQLSQVFGCASALLGFTLAVLACLTGQLVLLWVSSVCFALLYAIWGRFFLRLLSSDPVFALQAALFKPVDAAVMCAGMAAGFLYGIPAEIRRQAGEAH